MLNKVMIIGNLGADPETRYTQNGTPVTTFSVATTEKWKGQDGQVQQHTEWHRIVAWQKLAEICGEYLSKGSKVYIEGKLQTRKWKDQNGNDRYTTEITARDMKMLSPRSAGNGENTSRHQEPMPHEPGYGHNNEQFPMGDDVPF